MHNITFISTVHQENGQCNAVELCSILNTINPEVIFLEALEDTYSEYQKMIFMNFGLFHQKLEIQAIQKYSTNATPKYVPVLDIELSELFNKKYNQIGRSRQLQSMLDNYNTIANKGGFQFLNSTESMELHEEMRSFENRYLNNNELNEAVFKDIDCYENSMIQNIYSYCNKNTFNNAVFMCGVAHRRSIIEKIRSINNKENLELNWKIYGR